MKPLQSIAVCATLLILAVIGSFAVRSETTITGGAGAGGGGGSGTVWSSPVAFASLGTCDGGATGVYTALTDGGYDFVRCNGTSWVPFKSGYQMSPPQSSEIGTTWTWINKGTATAVNTIGPLLLTAPAASGVNVRALVTTSPATPWTRSFHVSINQLDIDFMKVGLLLRNTGTDALYTCGLSRNAAQRISSHIFTNPTTFGSTPSESDFASLIDWSGFWITIGDDGVNGTCAVGPRLDMMRTIYSGIPTGLGEFGVFVSTENTARNNSASFNDVR